MIHSLIPLTKQKHIPNPLKENPFSLGFTYPVLKVIFISYPTLKNVYYPSSRHDFKVHPISCETYFGPSCHFFSHVLLSQIASDGEKSLMSTKGKTWYKYFTVNMLKDSLSWEDHVENVISKLNQHLWLVRKVQAAF